MSKNPCRGPGALCCCVPFSKPHGSSGNMLCCDSGCFYITVHCIAAVTASVIAAFKLCMVCAGGGSKAGPAGGWGAGGGSRGGKRLLAREAARAAARAGTRAADLQRPPHGRFFFLGGPNTQGHYTDSYSSTNSTHSMPSVANDIARPMLAWLCLHSTTLW